MLVFIWLEDCYVKWLKNMSHVRGKSLWYNVIFFVEILELVGLVRRVIVEK